MERKDNMPLWVFLGISSINTRKGGQILVWSCFIFAIACIPLSPAVSWLPLTGPDCFACGFLPIPESIRLDDWSWVGLTLVLTAWYQLCVMWVDKHSTWETPAKSPKNQEGSDVQAVQNNDKP